MLTYLFEKYKWNDMQGLMLSAQNLEPQYLFILPNYDVYAKI